MKGLKSDAEVALFLLDRFVSPGFVMFMKYVRFANLATFVARISSMLMLASLCVVFSHENS